MKIKMYFTLLFIAINAYAYGHGHSSCVMAKSHLMEINPEWQFHLEAYDCDLDFPINFSNDDERIEFHLNHVVSYLTQKSENLNQDSKKEAYLKELLSYASSKEFPRNHFHKNRQPYFVDNDGRHCAVAHLMRFDNQSPLIEKIRSEKNNHFIKEMNSEAVLDWAVENNFIEDELALIQPGYFSNGLIWSSWGDGNGIDGRVNVMKSILQDQLLVLGGEFTSVDGVAANNVIAWNGSNWITFGSGVDGVVHDIIDATGGSLIIAGEFNINGIKSNIALWDASQNSWISLVESMDGVIYCMEVWNDQLFIGGSFNELNNFEMSNLAYLDLYGDTWSNQNDDGIGGAFSVDGTVRDFEIFENELIVVGAFLETGKISTSAIINQDSCTYLSVWNGNNWVHDLQGEYSEIHHLDNTGGLLTLVGNPANDKCVATWGDMGLEWYIRQDNLAWTEYELTEESEFNGIHNGFIFGDFSYINFDLSQNYTSYSSRNSIHAIDGSITAITDFQGEQYIAGKFTQLEGSSFNGLAKTDGTLPSQEIEELDLKIYSSFNSLYLKGNIEEAGSLQILNELGQVVQRHSFDENRWPEQIDLGELHDGIYFYQLEAGEHKLADRMVLAGN